MIKRIFKDLFLIAMYELGKYITNQILIKMQANDDVDRPPQDFTQDDHIHLNAEVSE